MTLISTCNTTPCLSAYNAIDNFITKSVPRLSTALSPESNTIPQLNRLNFNLSYYSRQYRPHFHIDFLRQSSEQEWCFHICLFQFEIFLPQRMPAGISKFRNWQPMRAPHCNLHNVLTKNLWQLVALLSNNFSISIFLQPKSSAAVKIFLSGNFSITVKNTLPTNISIRQPKP